MKLLIDSREPPHILSQIKKYPAFKDYSVVSQELPCGDVWLNDGEVIVERKTVPDLLASIADNRIFNQANEMRQLTEWCYIVITDPLMWNDKDKIIGTDWHFRSVQGALLRVQELGVCVTHAANEQDFPGTLAWLLSKEREKIVTIWPRKFGIPMVIGEKIISSLPGLGQEKTSQLLTKFGSVIEVLLCLVNDDCDLQVAGIGKKTRQNIRQALGLSNNQKIVIVEDENGTTND